LRSRWAHRKWRQQQSCKRGGLQCSLHRLLPELFLLMSSNRRKEAIRPTEWAEARMKSFCGVFGATGFSARIVGAEQET
jgi:hypothetical protein